MFNRAQKTLHRSAIPEIQPFRSKPPIGNQQILQALSGGEDPTAMMLREDLMLEIAGVSTGDTLAAPISNQDLLRRARDLEGVNVEGVVQGLPQNGRPLPPDVLERMNRAFGHDFSHVRIHTDNHSAEVAEQLHAHAFTMGCCDIYFGTSEFQPGTSQGDRLIAHELTHVLQRDQGRLQGQGVSSPTDSAEREAYSMETQILGHLSDSAEVAQETSAETISDSQGSEGIFSQNRPSGVQEPPQATGQADAQNLRASIQRALQHPQRAPAHCVVLEQGYWALTCLAICRGPTSPP